jgi:triosephosphate isomerase
MPTQPMQRLLIAGNWKMHGTLNHVNALIHGILQGAIDYTDIDILVLPTFVHLPVISHHLLHSQLHSQLLLGAQNLYLGKEGAYTGEVSGPMLKEAGCQYVLIGHSERRTIFHEDLALIAGKFKAAKEAGLIPILCVGETLAQRKAGETEAVIKAQIDSVIHAHGIDAFQQAVIAYEPVWAIGTGVTASPEDAQAVHAFIRRLISQNKVDLANTIRILYGGSMKPDNALSLLSMPDIDGGLIGGASLDAASFLAICKTASSLKV